MSRVRKHARDQHENRVQSAREVETNPLLMAGDPPRILSEKECDDIVARVRAFAKGGGDTDVKIKSWWQGELRWGRNRVSLAGDRRDILVTVTRRLPKTHDGWGVTNQIDDASLEAAVRAAERNALLGIEMVGKGVGFYPKLPKFTQPAQPIWSDATAEATTEARAKLIRPLLDDAEAKGLLSAGYLEVRAASIMAIGTEVPELRQDKYAYWEKRYQRWTQAQCSVTVRDQQGTGSGWAGLSSYDLAKLDIPKVGDLALKKCLASQNAVALEPGRYTVILEPAAVAGLMELVVRSFSDRAQNEFCCGPWKAPKSDYSKLGQKVMDDRISIGHDPSDPRMGVLLDGVGDPKPVLWVKNGILNALGVDNLEYAAGQLRQQHGVRKPLGYQMSGGKTSVEEMIATTQRGLLVTRFSNIVLLHEASIQEGGFTRDGLWLIENGKITQPVKNFRFAESVLGLLNRIDQLGEPVPVLRASGATMGDMDAYLDTPGLVPAIVPPIKARDFNFIAMIDAV